MNVQSSHASAASRIFVTGGSGFIGSHLVNLCVERKHEVWVYDNFSRGRKEFLADAPNLRIVTGDILDADKLACALQEAAPNVVYHLAAIHHIPECERNPRNALRVNVEGTQSLLSCCAHVGAPRIVFASTGAVYDIPTNPADALTEDCPLAPRDIYGISKLTGEGLVRYHAFLRGAEAVVARLFNTVGRNETNAHVIPDIITQITKGVRELRLGNLDSCRDYVHVQDVAEALFSLGRASLPKPVETYNVGAGREYSVRDIVDMLAEIIGERLTAISTQERQRKTDRPNQLSDTSKLQRDTGWKPSRSLRQALLEIWKEQNG